MSRRGRGTRSRLALVTVCYDRWSFLDRVRPSWRRLSGPPPVFAATYEDDDVSTAPDDIYRVTVPPSPFHLTRVRNCAAAAARDTVDPEYLIFIDSDIEVLDPDALLAPLGDVGTPPHDYILDSPFAISDELLFGSGDDPEKQERGKRGTHLVRADFFFEVGGYDQRFIGWGLDDRNLYLRYARVSERRAYYDRTALRHLSHGGELRTRHNPDGVSSVAGRLANLRTHLERLDVYGRAWADDFGYPEWSLTRPTGA